MSKYITDISINEASIQRKLLRLFNDETVMLKIHQEFYRYMYPYIPMGDSGLLAGSVEVTSDGVRFTQPYAHYQYTGLVFGPNFPIVKNGVIVGWYSKPGQPKSPTGERLKYNTDYHPLASSHWDKAMMRDRGDEFTNAVKEILKRRAREL